MCVGEVFELLDDLGEALFGEHLIDVAGQLVDLVLLAQLDELFHGIYKHTHAHTFQKTNRTNPKREKNVHGNLCLWWETPSSWPRERHSTR